MVNIFYLSFWSSNGSFVKDFTITMFCVHFVSRLQPHNFFLITTPITPHKLHKLQIYKMFPNNTIVYPHPYWVLQ